MGNKLSLLEEVEKNSIQQVQKLIKDGADVNQTVSYKGKPTTLLHIAASKGYEGIIKLLISNGALIEAKNHKGSTALHVAAKNNQISIVKLLLDFGANVNAIDKFHVTPLHLATQNGNCQCIKMLLDYKANVDPPFLRSDPPLRIAILKDKIDVMKILLNNGANPNRIKQSNWLDILIRIQYSRQKYDILQLLIAYGADLDSKDSTGSNCLHRAFVLGDKKLAKLLLRNGACINIKDDEKGYNAIENSIQYNNFGFAKHILYNVGLQDI